MVAAHKIGLKLTWVVFLLALGTTACSRRRDNEQVVSDVQNRIRTDRRLTGARVQVRAGNGIVTLSGYVGDSGQRVTIVRDASQIVGVKVVIDDLRVIDSDRPSPGIAVQQPPASTIRDAIPPKSPALREIKPFHQLLSVDSPHRPAPAETIVAPSAANSTASASSAAPATVEAHSSNAPPSAMSANSSPNLTRVVAERTSSPEQVSVPYGTVLEVRLTETVSSDLNQKGDTFLGSLASPVMIGDRVVIPAEAGIQGKVVEAQDAGRFSGRPVLAIEVTRLGYNGRSYDLRSSQYRKEGVSREVGTAAKIGGGAGVGAIIGAILGGGKGAAIGAIIGAGTGTGAQAASRGRPVHLPAESMVSFRLIRPITVVPSSTLQAVHGAGADSSQDPFPSDERPVLKRRPGTPPADADPADASPPSPPPGNDDAS